MTPQQENELLDCPMCGCAATYVKHSAGIPGTQGFDKWDAVACKHCRTTVGACDRRFRNRDDASAAWNRRAPAPTEPAVDRDAVLEEAAMACEAWGDAKVIKWQDSPDMLEDAKARAWDGLQCAHAVRALKLATPASPAVPEPIEQAFTDALMGGLGVVRIDPSTMFEPQVAQASQPTSAGEFPGVNIDRAHHIMDGYTPKPPPPRPQRPPGPLWTDAERQRFRENMKRGERCPICSVIEGGQHFPGCSRGTP